MTTPEVEQADLLAIGAHPDDLEIGCGGILAKLAAQGRRVVILDLTRGEMGSRGDAMQRHREATEAARILGVACRENAGLPDGAVANTNDQQLQIIPFIRQHRPKALLTLMTPDRHPDHAAAHALGRDANYFSGLTRIDTGQTPWRAPLVYFYHPYTDFAGTPPGVVDVSEVFEVKLEALRAYTSQFHNPAFPGPETYIASKAFWEGIETRARFWGNRIGARYGEPLFTDGPLPLDNLPGL